LVRGALRVCSTRALHVCSIRLLEFVTNTAG